MEPEWVRIRRHAARQREVVDACIAEMDRALKAIEDATEEIGIGGLERLRRRFDAACVLVDEQRDELNRLEGNADAAQSRAAFWHGGPEEPAEPTPKELVDAIVASPLSDDALARRAGNATLAQIRA